MVLNEITTAGTRSAKASKALDTMRARIVKADEARTEAAHNARAAQVKEAATTLFDSPRAVAGHLEGRGGAEDGAAVDAPGLRRLSDDSLQPKHRPRTMMLLRIIVHFLGNVPRFSADVPHPVVYIPDAVPPTKRRGVALPSRKQPVIRVGNCHDNERRWLQRRFVEGVLWVDVVDIAAVGGVV